MSADALCAAIGEASDLFDPAHVPVVDTSERLGRELAPETMSLSFPETPLEAAARYVRTYEGLRGRRRRSLLVTHGFAVQAIADTCDADLYECEVCSITRISRKGPQSPWTCDLVADTSHLAGLSRATPATLPPEGLARVLTSGSADASTKGDE